jgi:hypothetical protein
MLMSSLPETIASSAPATSQAQLSSSFALPTSYLSAPASSFAVPSNSFVPPTSEAPAPTDSLVLITSVVTQSPELPGGSAVDSLVVITSTAIPTPVPTSSLTRSSSSTQSSSSGAALLATGSADGTAKSGGFSQGGKIAVAVVVPIVAIALLVVGLLFFWKKRKARKSAEEQRKKEMEEYGFNPNNDPTLPPVSATYGENKPEEAEDGVGYRGWGTTNSATTREPSANVGSGRGGIGMAMSDGGSNGGGFASQASPSNGEDRPSDGQSNEPLVSGTGARPTTGDSDLGALGAAPIAGAARQDRGVHRGPSNASSAYSNGPPRSEGSDDVPLPGGAPAGPYYHEDSPYYNDGPGQPGFYGDSSYGPGQPVIRDVQARRNTRIERPSVFPPQGNSGIAQNF